MDKTYQDKMAHTNDLVGKINEQFEEEVDVNELNAFLKNHKAATSSLKMVIENLKDLVLGYERKEIMVSEKEYDELMTKIAMIAMNTEMLYLVDSGVLGQAKKAVLGTPGADSEALLKRLEKDYGHIKHSPNDKLKSVFPDIFSDDDDTPEE